MGRMLVHVGRIGVKGGAEQQGEGEQVRQGKCMQPRKEKNVPVTPFKVHREAL